MLMNETDCFESCFIKVLGSTILTLISVQFYYYLLLYLLIVPANLRLIIKNNKEVKVYLYWILLATPPAPTTAVQTKDLLCTEARILVPSLVPSLL